MTDTVLKTLYQEAHKFLIGKAGKGFVEKHLESIPCTLADKIQDIFQCLLNALVSTKRMKEIIGSVEALASPFFGFDPIRTHSHYKDQWDKLYENLKQLEKPGSIEDNSQEEYRDAFCMGALSGASFLSQLGSVETFRSFINGFRYNNMTRAVLPLLLQKEIYGMGFPMACTFLNNIGYPDYISPNPKVKALLKDTGVTESMDNYEALKALIIMARANQKEVPQVHNMFGLIGHGNLSEDSNNDPGHRKEFVEHITSILNNSDPT